MSDDSRLDERISELARRVSTNEAAIQIHSRWIAVAESETRHIDEEFRRLRDAIAANAAASNARIDALKAQIDSSNKSMRSAVMKLVWLVVGCGVSAVSTGIVFYIKEGFRASITP